MRLSLVFTSVQYRADFVHSQLRKRSNVYSNLFRDARSCKPADVQRIAIKVSMTAFFDAPRQFDFVFRHGRPVLPSLFLRRIVSPARRSKLYGSYFLFNADAVSGTLDDSTRLCVRSPPFPVYVHLSFTFRLRFPLSLPTAFLRGRS